MNRCKLKNRRLCMAGVALTGWLVSSAVPAAQAVQGTVQRTLVYHDFTETFHRAALPVLSDNGNKAVYAKTQKNAETQADEIGIYVARTDGTATTQVDAVVSNPDLDLSADGSTAMSVHQTQGGGPRLIRIADSAGARTIVQENSVELASSAISGDGLKVFFLLRRDSSFDGSNIPAPGGLWTIDSDGTDLRQVVSREQIPGLLGTPVSDFISFDNNYGVDCSTDGTRIVFAGNVNDKRYIFGVNRSGTGLHVIDGPSSYIPRVAISGDATKVLYALKPYPFGTGVTQWKVANFDGSGKRVVADANSAGEPSARGVMLDNNGSHALLNTYLIYNTDGSGVLQLNSPSAANLGASMYYGSMDKSGTRIVFQASESFDAPLSLLEINPASRGAAPNVREPQVDPAFLIKPEANYARMQVRATSPTPISFLTFRAYRKGLYDQHILVGSSSLFDDGVNGGDSTAGDGIYNTDSLRANGIAELGARIVRLHAGTVDGAGRNHGTAIDFTPLTVIDNTTISSLSGRVIKFGEDGVAVGLPNVNVHLNGGTAKLTDADGRYTFNNVAAGSYTVSVDKTGFTFVPPSRTNIPVGKDAVTGVNFKTYAIFGFITNNAGGAVLGVTVNLTGAATATVVTDVRGHYNFKGLGTGSYTVTPAQEGFTFGPAPQKEIALPTADKAFSPNGKASFTRSKIPAAASQAASAPSGHAN